MEAPSHLIPYFNCCAYSSLTEVNMLPSINFQYVLKDERVSNGRVYINYHDMGDMQFDIPFKEIASRSNLDISDMFSYARVHCDAERIAEEMKKAGFSYRELMAIAQHMVEEVV
ncbi:hypothetical protein J8V57_09785 [Xenorhabdus sp. PB61.4]|uniref:hypothetical protein n=1 Tax=Xenorhabdus sp. PB61.4 TaxID=2788940 RepID=UPI001E30F3C9|nr:hypothetical protein [Xenorhabdus sp. PB61.4]MCC8366571.1 hypothetical protein [Xenorhabdus sp. PB61.4]